MLQEVGMIYHSERIIWEGYSLAKVISLDTGTRRGKIDIRPVRVELRATAQI